MTLPEIGKRFSDFLPHVTSIPLRGMAHRDPEGMRVSRSGRAQVNAAASQWIIGIARSTFGDISKCGIIWGSNEQTRTVAGRLVDPQTPGATPIRQRSKNGDLVVYMNNVFSDKPNLRPRQTCWVGMSPRMDENGPWFVVHLSLAQGVTNQFAPKSETKTDAVRPALEQAAAAKQEG